MIWIMINQEVATDKLNNLESKDKSTEIVEVSRENKELLKLVIKIKNKNN